jgi:hypothetical protein
VADRESRATARENRRVKGLERTRPVPAGFVQITHPAVEGTTRVAEKSLNHWRRRGWTEVTDDAPAAPTPDPETAGDPAAAPAPAAKATPTPRRNSAPTGQES